jgi:hypothetical protein
VRVVGIIFFASRSKVIERLKQYRGVARAAP